MSKVRVYELARELNVETKVMMAKLKSFGVSINNHQATLTDQLVADLRRAFGTAAAAAQPSAAAPSAAATAGKPRVVIRRRASVDSDTGAESADAAEAPVATPSAAAAPSAAAPSPTPPVAVPPAAVVSAKVETEAKPAVMAPPPAAAAPLSSVAEPIVKRPEAEVAKVVESQRPVTSPSPVAASVEANPVTEAKATPSHEAASPVMPQTAAVAPPQPTTPASAAVVTPAPSSAPAVPAAAFAASTSVSAPASVSGGGASMSASSSSSTTSSASSSSNYRAPLGTGGRGMETSRVGDARPFGSGPRPGPIGSGTPVGAPATAQAGAGATSSGPDDALKPRRREVAGATIVRRATQEEREKLQNQQGGGPRSMAGRKEDNRGTRVTGMGLLTNRVTAPTSAAPAPGAAPFEGESQESWAGRRGGHKESAKRAAEEEEIARKKAAAKARRSHTNLTTRALLEQAEEIISAVSGPDPAEVEEVVAVVPQPRTTVYTPTAQRNKRDLKRRKDLKKTQITTPRASYRVVEMGDAITVGDLARQLAIKASEIIKKLMGQGVMATINQALDLDTATLIASEYQFEVKSTVTTVEDILGRRAVESHELETRPPIVTVMGHVDHGKTSILDAIRSANVAAGEAGGITQHIGAYTIERDGRRITFLDTPGHEAFSAMRARGAKVTDIVVLVVAGDDGVMPQTIEAINHAKAANVPIIVAVNKMDKPGVKLDRVFTELTEHGVQVEEWGGDVQAVRCSALQRTGIDDLIEAIHLQAEVLDLKATSDGNAEGTVIEAHLDRGRGPVATVVVQQGTLKVGDYLVAGTEVGRVRAMVDYLGREQKGAGPAIPVEIIGLSGVPMAGDKFDVVADEKTAREVSLHRIEAVRKAQGLKSSAAKLEDLLAKVKSEEAPEVVFIVKADTQGSVEAISESITKLSSPKVKNRIVHAAPGGITESDVTLAAASNGIIIGFNVRAVRGIDDVAEKQGVVIKYFSIIYEIVDAVKSIMVGKLPPLIHEVVLGHAEVRKTISVPKFGTIAGSAVLDGKITRSAHCRLVRDQVVIYQGKLGSLRRFKDDVKEVQQGYECGIGIDGYNDIREGDVIEAYILEEQAASL